MEQLQEQLRDLKVQLETKVRRGGGRYPDLFAQLLGKHPATASLVGHLLQEGCWREFRLRSRVVPHLSAGVYCLCFPSPS